MDPSLYQNNPLTIAQSFGYNPRLKPPVTSSGGGGFSSSLSAGTSPTSTLTPTPSPTIGDSYKQFSSIFGPPQSIDPNKIAADIQRLINQHIAPTITAPTVTPAQIQLPGGTYDQYRKDLYNKDFLPVSQEVQRQRTQADTALSGQLAQAGLSDSGAGVGQREMQAEHYDTFLQQQAANMSAAAGATAAQAEIGVLSANAQLTQQARLANAGFDLTAQTENARNILQGNTMAAQGYLAALGISGQQAAAYRDSFLRYLGGEEQAAAQKDQFRLGAQSTYLNFTLQQRTLDQHQYEIEAQNNMNAIRNANDSTQIANQFKEAMAQIDAKGQNWRGNVGGAEPQGGGGGGGASRSAGIGGGGGGNQTEQPISQANGIDPNGYAANNPWYQVPQGGPTYQNYAAPQYTTGTNAINAGYGITNPDRAAAAIFGNQGFGGIIAPGTEPPA